MLRLAKRLNATAQLGSFKLPEIRNEPMYSYEPGSAKRIALVNSLNEMRSKLSKGPFEVPCVVGDKNYWRNLCSSFTTGACAKGMQFFKCKFGNDSATNALDAKPKWEAMPFNDRCAIFLKAADLLTSKYRYEVMAATMIGQGKNAWQAEIDAAAELADFWRFNCHYAAEIYKNQPTMNSPLTWNRTEYRALEGFVVAYSPFNFTAIGGNLVSAPALMGNVVLWKPSNTAIYSNYLVYQILREAGLPEGVIQFLPCDPVLMTNETFTHKDFAGLHFTGSTSVFKSLWKKIASNLDNYKSYPRIVGETGGKNMHFIHSSADIKNAALQTIRGAFEYSGQKCSATSRVYCPDSKFEEFAQILIEEHGKIKMGPVEGNFKNHVGPVINKVSFDKINGYLNDVKSGKNSTTKIIAGGNVNEDVGYYIEPTILVTKDPKSATMTNELFGPVVTIYVYPEEEFTETLQLADSTTEYALTCGFFAQDREAIITASNALRNTAGNYYINDKSTGAVVGQQPFGGGRMSGTNDKAGSGLNLLRWVSPRTIKETFVPITTFEYPSNQ